MLNLKDARKLAEALGCSAYKPSNLPPAEFISTGIISFDYVSGGGLVRGTPHELFGDTNLGKTTIALGQCKNFCKLGLGARYFDAEKRLFSNSTDRVFHDGNENEVEEPDFEGTPSGLAQALTEEYEDLFLIYKISTFEQLFTILEAEAAAGFQGLVIIDSLATLQSKMGSEAQDKDIEASRMGGFIASPLSRIAPRLKDTLADNLITAIVINQTRARTSQYQVKENRPGGTAIQFLYSTTFQLAGNSKPEAQLTAADGSPLVLCIVKTDKSSFTSAYRKGDYALSKNGVDLAYCLYAFLVDDKLPSVLKRVGNKWFAPEECVEELNLPEDGLLAKKKDGVYTYLADPANKAVYDWLYRYIYDNHIQVKPKVKDDHQQQKPEDDRSDRNEPGPAAERVFTAADSTTDAEPTFTD